MTSFPFVHNVAKVGESITVVEGQDFGIIQYPLCHPRLATSFFGFRAIPEDTQALIAVFGTHNSQEGYFKYQNNTWTLSDSPYFHSVSQMREGMNSWVGALNLVVKISQGQILSQIEFGYEVNLEITEYLLRFALPKLLSRSYRVIFPAIAKDDGQVTFPTGFVVERINQCFIQALDAPKYLAQISDGNLISPNISPNQEVQITIDFTPFVEYARGLYQVQSIPTILIREVQLKNYVTPYRSAYLPVDDAYNLERDYPAANFDIDIELNIMASQMSTAKAIAQQVIHFIQKTGRVYLPPFDLDIGILFQKESKASPVDFTGGEGVDSSSDLIGGISTSTLQLTLKRINI